MKYFVEFRLLYLMNYEWLQLLPFYKLRYNNSRVPVQECPAYPSSEADAVSVSVSCCISLNGVSPMCTVLADVPLS